MANDQASSQVKSEGQPVSETHAELLAKIEALFPAEFHEINPTSFSSRSKRITTLLANKDPQHAIQSRSEWLSFELLEIQFVVRVELIADGFSSYDSFEFSYIDSFSGETRFASASPEEGKATFYINHFVRGFGIKPPSKYFVSPKLVSVVAFGLPPQELEALVGQFAVLSSAKEKLVQDAKAQLDSANAAKANKELAEKELEELGLELEETNNKISNANSALQTTEGKLAEKQKELDTVNSAIGEKNSAFAALEDQIEKNVAERKLINADVTNAQNELAELRRNIHLFPSEIAGYIKQGNKDTRLYAAFCAVLILLMFGVTYRLFGNSELLLEFFLSDKRPPIGEYLLSRLPYVTVNAAILAVCYTILRRLFAEIIAINRRKQDLHKVSIIATDVSFASLQGLPIDEETSYHLRTQTKMELLKEHLRQHMSDDYSYGMHDSGISRLLEAARKKLDTKIDGDGESSP